MPCTRRLLAFACLAAGLAGCGPAASSPSGNAGPSRTGGNGTSGSSVTVDLVITGDRPAVVKGTKGRCVLIHSPSYEFSGADYPDLGTGGDVSIVGPMNPGGPPSLKALIGDGGFLDTDGGGIHISPDQKTVTVDQDLNGSLPGTMEHPGAPLHDHVRGTITCS